jgi:hypothetical protein
MDRTRSAFVATSSGTTPLVGSTATRGAGRGGLGLILGLGLALSGCATDSSSREDRSSELPVSENSCGESGRADTMVRKEAVIEFQKYGKSCQPYEMTNFPQNDRETLWHVCCGGMALNFIFFPAKCVAHRGSGPVACQNQ